MKRKLKAKPKTKKEEAVLVINGSETAAELYTKYIATQDLKVREAWKAKYKEEKGATK